MIRERTTPLRAAGAILAVLLAIAVLAMHPHVSGRLAPQSALRQLDALGVRDRLVHGVLLVLLAALLTGCTRYALRRGVNRPAVVAGLVCFAAGVGGLCVAGLLDGFVLPEIVARSVSASPNAQSAALAILEASFVAVNIFSWFGIFAMALAIGAWSLDLVGDSGKNRTAGTIGFVSAAVSVAVLIMSGPYLTPHSLVVITAAQGTWYACVAVLLSRERVQSPPIS